MARIALAEDDPDIRRMVEIALSASGHQVDAFEDGAAALLALDEGSHDLLLSDVMMPRLDGISLCRAVRARDRRLPIVLLSALSREEEILEGYEAGADDYIIKPFTVPVLRARVRRALDEGVRGVEVPAEVGPEILQTPICLPARFDRYELRVRLGEGGYSTVYAGVDALGRPVAVKVFVEDLGGDRGTLGRYFREVTVLREVSCPGVVHVLDSGFALGRFFLVMEPVQGRSAGELLHELGPLPVEDVVRVGRDVAQALGDLAEHGLIHRDVKPSNIMIEPSGRSVLIDFGLAKGRADMSVTTTSELLGTAQYLAPELVRGTASESAASDLYSLGASVYELLTGRPPHPGEGYAVLKQIAAGTPAAPVDSRRAGLPGPLVGLVEELLRPDVKQRLSDPRQVAERFAALLG